MVEFRQLILRHVDQPEQSRAEVDSSQSKEVEINRPCPTFELRAEVSSCAILFGMAQQVWVVRAGRDSLYVGEFLSKSMVAIGWAKLGDLSRVRTKDEITRLVEQNWPDNNKFQNMVSIGQVYRFREELTPGKPVVTYDSNRRIYHLGEIT